MCTLKIVVVTFFRKKKNISNNKASKREKREFPSVFRWLATRFKGEEEKRKKKKDDTKITYFDKFRVSANKILYLFSSC